MSAWPWVDAIHLVCAVIWVGGMFFALIVLRPSLGVLEPAPRIAIHNQVFRRFFRIIWHVMPIALITGYAMALGQYGGFAHLPWYVNAMQAIAWVMVIVFLWIVFGPYRRFRAAASNARAAAAADTIRKLIVLNLILGLLVVCIAVLRF